MKNKLQVSLASLGIGLMGFLRTAELQGAEFVQAKNGSGVYGYNDTPRLLWCGFRVHDPDRPAPKRIHPGPAPAPATPPSDALILFDGHDLSKWQPTECKVVDGCIEAVGGGNLTSKESFGNCQIHLEWMAPNPPSGPWYNRGNNGVFLMGLYEIMWFNDHGEAHIHARYGRQVAKFRIRDAAWLDGSLPPRVAALVVEWTLLNQAALFEAWSQIRQGRKPPKIKGLE